MIALDAALRGGAITVLLLLALTGWRDGRNSPAARYAVLFDFCAIAYALETTPPFVESRPLWLIPSQIASMATPAVFQLWASASFDDAFTPRWWRWLPLAGMVALTTAAIATDWTPAWYATRIAALLLVGVGVWQILAGRAGDLVEGRRRFRLVLAIGVGALIVALTVFGLMATPGLRRIGGAATIAGVLAFAFAAALHRLRMEQPVGAMAPVGGAAVDIAPREMEPKATIPSGNVVDAEERALLARLRQLMEGERLYREEGLGVARLAARLAIPEYRLRRLINQRLGHRNITSFVNGYRLIETMQALGDPSQAQVPILTIALDAGFQSIGPFNRAFKAHTGLTPSAFRRDRLSQIVARVAK